MVKKKIEKEPEIEDELDIDSEVEEAIEEIEELDLDELEEDEFDEDEIRICKQCGKKFKCSEFYSKTQMEYRDIGYDEVICHLCALYFIDKTETKEEYEKSEKSKLETSSIKEKLKTIAYPDKKGTNQYSPDLIEIAQDHLDLIKQLDYNYSIMNYVDYLAECYGHNTLTIKKEIRTPILIIKEYWEMYDKKIEEEKLRKQMSEQFDKLDNTQLSELYLNVLKESIGGSAEKSNKEYLIDLMIRYKINLF